MKLSFGFPSREDQSLVGRCGAGLRSVRFQGLGAD